MRKLLIILAGASLVAFTAWITTRTAPRRAIVTVGQSSFVVEVAANPVAQSRGLRGRPALAADHGMFFPFAGGQVSPPFTMDGVLLPLDLVWVADGRVVGLTIDLPPARSGAGTRYPAPRPVNAVLEVLGGTVRSRGIEVGDPVQVHQP